MKKIKLTQGKYVIVDNLDFEYLNQWKWYFSSSGYAMRKPYIRGSGHKHQKGESIQMHRLITNAPKEMWVDHINHDKLDNQKLNLRVVTPKQNAANSKLPITNKSGFKGVSWHSQTKKWIAWIRNNNKNIYLGTYKIKKEAALAYDFGVICFRDSFSSTNFGVKKINLLPNAN